MHRVPVQLSCLITPFKRTKLHWMAEKVNYWQLLTHGRPTFLNLVLSRCFGRQFPPAPFIVLAGDDGSCHSKHLDSTKLGKLIADYNLLIPMSTVARCDIDGNYIQPNRISKMHQLRMRAWKDGIISWPTPTNINTDLAQSWALISD